MFLKSLEVTCRSAGPGNGAIDNGSSKFSALPAPPLNQLIQLSPLGLFILVTLLLCIGATTRAWDFKLLIETKSADQQWILTAYITLAPDLIRRHNVLGLIANGAYVLSCNPPTFQTSISWVIILRLDVVSAANLPPDKKLLTALDGLATDIAILKNRFKLSQLISSWPSLYLISMIAVSWPPSIVLITGPK